MCDYDVSSNKWTGAQRLCYREIMTPTCGIISLVIGVVAHIVYYKFPRLRVFPRSILAWINLYNIFFACYLIWKWSPGSALHYSWGVNIVPASVPCRISLFIDNYSSVGLISCDTLIAITVFSVIFFPGHIESNMTRYRVVYICWVMFMPIASGLYATFNFQKQQQQLGASCAVTDSARQVSIIRNIVLIGLQFLLIVSSVAKIIHMTSKVTAISGHNFPIMYLIGRFIIMYFTQSFTVIPVQLQSTWKPLMELAIYSRFAFLSRALGPSFDALVFMFANADFVDWLRAHFSSLRNRFSRNFRDNQSETPPRPITVQLDVYNTIDSDSQKTVSEEQVDAAAIV